jgi:hypothetical protein
VLGGEMQNKKWESKMKSLLHSLDIDSGSSIDEIKQFAPSTSDFNKKIKKIASDYKKHKIDDSPEAKKDFNEELNTFDKDDPEFEEMLDKFFKEISNDTPNNPKDPLIDAVLMWFHELLIINAGLFKIVKNEDGSISIEFGTDEIMENNKKISLTDELTHEISKIDKKSILKNTRSDKPQQSIKKPATKKTATKKPVAKNATRTRKTTETPKKATKNKNTK